MVSNKSVTKTDIKIHINIMLFSKCTYDEDLKKTKATSGKFTSQRSTFKLDFISLNFPKNIPVVT